MENNITPLPWCFVDYSGYYNIQNGEYYEDLNVLDIDVCPEALENAKFLVKAVNNHDTLVEALKEAKTELSLLNNAIRQELQSGRHLWEGMPELIDKRVSHIKESLSKAGE